MASFPRRMAATLGQALTLRFTSQAGTEKPSDATFSEDEDGWVVLNETDWDKRETNTKKAMEGSETLRVEEEKPSAVPFPLLGAGSHGATTPCTPEEAHDPKPASGASDHAEQSPSPDQQQEKVFIRRVKKRLLPQSPEKYSEIKVLFQKWKYFLLRKPERWETIHGFLIHDVVGLLHETGNADLIPEFRKFGTLVSPPFPADALLSTDQVRDEPLGEAEHTRWRTPKGRRYSPA
ncbi:hypothetical protein V8F20_011642 [Naviculisporaceae sp. PSN 640]